MAISKMSKIMLVGHLDEFDRFVDDLQHQSIFHPAELPQCIDSSNNYCSKFKTVSSPNDPVRQQVEEIRVFLEPYRPKMPSFQKLVKPKACITRDQYQTIIQKFNVHRFL